MKSIAAALAAVVLAGTAQAAETSLASYVNVLIVGDGGGTTELPERLREILSDPPLPLQGRVQIARAGNALAGDLFDRALPGANHPAAWVVVDSRIVHIRAASAGRAQFVFRDITISQPMTDLDRERVGQTLRSALTVVIEESPGALSRNEAMRAVGFEEPPPAATATPADVARAEPLPAPLAPVPSPPSDGGPLQFRLAGFFEVSRIHSHYAYGPGLNAGLDLSAFPVRLGLWLQLVTFLPEWMNSNSTVSPYSSSIRFGVGVDVPGVPVLRLELGGGYDWNRPLYIGSGLDKIWVYRGAVRLGPTRLAGANASLCVFVERATQSFDSTQSLGAGGPATREGLALELWWL